MFNDLMLNKDFFNEDGLVTDNPPFRDLENLSVWTYYYWSLFFLVMGTVEAYRSLQVSRRAIMSLRGDRKFHPCPDHSALPEEGMSRDNMMAVVSTGLSQVCFSQDRSCERYISGVMCKAGIMQYSYRYLQPQDTFYFLYAFLVFSNKKWVMDIKKWVLLPLLIPTFLSMTCACLFRKTTRTGALDTNGVLLSYMRCSALLMLFTSAWPIRKIYWFFITYLASRSIGVKVDVESQREISPLRTCITEYFQNKDHSIHNLATLYDIRVSIK